jgi:Transcriptional regulator, AbiEi antitoxin
MELHDLAEHDLVSTAAAASIGVDPSALQRLVRAGSLRRVIRGWYAVHAPGQPRAPWEGADAFETARRQHRLLTVALLKSFEGRVVASHQSALVLHGLPLWQADLATAHVCRVTTTHTRHRPSAVIHPPVPTRPVETPEGFRTVSLADAIVQVGLYPPDQPGRRTPMDSLIAADYALHHQLLSDEALERSVEQHARHPGIPVVRALLNHADGRHESPGETRLAHTMRLLGYAFTAQAALPGGRGYRGDFVLDEDPVVVEFDGLGKYALGTPSAEAGSAAAYKQNLAAEKRREEDVLRRSAHEFVRFTWAEVGDLSLVGGRIDAAVARARMRRPA